jgi:hypothetical protein
MFAAGTVDEETARRARHGMPVPLRAVAWTPDEAASDGAVERMVRIHDPLGRLLGLGVVTSGPGELEGVIRMRKVFVSDRVSS